MPASVAPRELARVLTLRDLVLIVVGTTIGSGIFTVPGAVLRQSGGDLGVALLVWLLGSVLALLGALMFEQLAHPEAARDLERAVTETLAAGVRTPDIGGKATTGDVARAIGRAL